MPLYVEFIAVIVDFSASNVRDVDMWMANHFGQLKSRRAFVRSMIVAVIRSRWSIAVYANLFPAQYF